ncbi:hypothetical protein E0E52_10410 [Azotobacter chroococcum]|uniref:hypothetical protein n=1 Tax=Azotobacter chroococcum TaxID=353 RepID=UPI00103B000D|nr:hypothetical protein [Azotobacter chroococcum]TBW07863.1 hypothetical protein E0E52_10410 [Azotobacter chroococcum]
MLTSVNRFFNTQSKRLQSLEPLEPITAPREIILEAFRERNALFDTIFYDVKVISNNEIRSIAPLLAAEGAILIVPPSGEGELSLLHSVDDFIANGGESIHTLAVAGVGSSALGSAAFARNIANAVKAPVAAVVSGYGAADIITEALGGFFLFGTLNSLRHAFEGLDRLRESGVISEPSGWSSSLSPTQTSRDTRTVEALLRNRRLKFDLLIGHSKGNLVLSEALYMLQKQNLTHLKEIAEFTRIVTISAKIAMPIEFNAKQVIDVIGTLDNLGAINSRPTIKTDYSVLGAWHHTNTDLFFHLPVTSTLETLQTKGLI